MRGTSPQTPRTTETTKRLGLALERLSGLHRGSTRRGFTIVELLIVVVVIAILAAITIVAYNGITANAKESALKADLTTAAKQLHLAKVENGSYPENADSLTKSDDTELQLTSTDDTFCLTATNPGSLPGTAFHVTESSSVQEGACSDHLVGDEEENGDSDSEENEGPELAVIQTITNANCPDERTVARDARDDRTYWVQKLADGKCWMLTNLAYGGDGTDTYGDVIPLGDGTGGTVAGGFNQTYTEAYYNVYSPGFPHPRLYTTSVSFPSILPSTDTTGGGWERQYGYHYNWCAAMGAQTSTSACANATTPLPNPTISICPAGWRLPSGGNGGEFQLLNNAVNNGFTNTDAGLRSTWLGHYGGFSGSSFSQQNKYGYYWTATQRPDRSFEAHNLYLYDSFVNPAISTGSRQKTQGLSVRCVTV